MLYNVWTKIQKPLNNHEREAKAAAEKLKQSTPQSIPGRPGWSICDGKKSYDPTRDPAWNADINRRSDEEAAAKKKAAAKIMGAAGVSTHYKREEAFHNILTVCCVDTPQLTEEQAKALAEHIARLNADEADEYTQGLL